VYNPQHNVQYHAQLEETKKENETRRQLVVDHFIDKFIKSYPENEAKVNLAKAYEYADAEILMHRQEKNDADK